MTIEELLARDAIRKTMAKYTVSGDRLQVEDCVSCFTEDGVMEVSSAPGEVDFRYAGHNEIRAWQNAGAIASPGRKASTGRPSCATTLRHRRST